MRSWSSLAVSAVALLAFPVPTELWHAEASLAAPTATEGPFQAVTASNLFALENTDKAPASTIWAEYQRFLLARDRATPFLLYFADSKDCSSGSDEGEDEDDDAWQWSSVEDRKEETIAALRDCSRHKELVEAAVALAAESLSSQQHPIVRLDARSFPTALHYHMVSSVPSLLWMPARSSGRFQRYPHVETNFLDLSVNGSLFAGKFSDFNSVDEAQGGADILPPADVEVQDQQQSVTTSEAVAGEIAAFVRQCHQRSGYVGATARGKPPGISIPKPEDEAFSVLDLLPILGLLAFVAVLVNENRVFVLSVVQTRLFWFVLCMAVMYVALSGLFHSIIHHRAWYYFSQQHGFVFVYPTSRRQFVLEGLVHGTWSFWLSLAAMSISDVVPALRSRLAREELIRWSLLLVMVSYMALHFAFLMKYRWLA
ncbi:hypothetical protein BBJ28_00008612 [Nothophytophthora sp. Chile5]|nr:hypothetical protein BBJ28_00008612 [Nothophytophthora sp. Chile5]